MWAVNANQLKMTEGDFGVQLPITISGPTFTQNDQIKFTLKNKNNGSVLITKTFSSITQNTINLELTESDSSALSVGVYVYTLDWYQDGAFLCNIIPSALFEVVDKA